MKDSKTDWIGREKVPTTYIGLSFLQWDGYDQERYNKLTESQKIEMGYWVETQAIRRGANMGIGIGMLLGVLFSIFFLL